jgi:hypothetical protein
MQKLKTESSAMSKWIDKKEEIGVGDQLLILDHALGESWEHPAEVIEIRRILGKPTYLVETGSGERKLVGGHQIRRIAYAR